jgi:hypothetical protein
MVFWASTIALTPGKSKIMIMNIVTMSGRVVAERVVAPQFSICSIRRGARETKQGLARQPRSPALRYSNGYRSDLGTAPAARAQF